MTQPTFTVLTDQELNALRSKLVEAGGDPEKAGVSLQDVRNAIYTKCFRVNPNIEAGGEAKPKAKGKGTKGPTLTGSAMDDILG